MQKRIGNISEKIVLEVLKNKGFWCHLFANKIVGQPCDIVALKDDKAFLMDVKHCENNKFAVSRIEPNQHACFKYAIECGVNNIGFAIVYNNRIKWLPYTLVDKNNCKYYNIESLEDFEDFIK